MTQPALPQQILLAQANALAVGERSLPFALPPLSQSLMSIATALPLGALPALPVPAAGASPFPGIPTAAPVYAPAQNGRGLFGQRGAPRALPMRVRGGLS
jgi:hypothetical protein